MTDITAVVLAAGLGSRLLPLTKSRPKCLIEIAETTILGNILQTLFVAGIRNCIVVVGYMADEVERYASSNSPVGMTVRFVFNSEYRTNGTARSTALGIVAVDPTHDILLLEGDVFVDKRVISLVASASISSTILAAYRPDLSGTFAWLNDMGFVTKWMHERQRPPRLSLLDAYKTVNISKFSAKDRAAYLAVALERAQLLFGKDAPFEFAAQIALAEMFARIQGIVVSSLPWIEIDTVEDYKEALRLFGHTNQYSGKPN